MNARNFLSYDPEYLPPPFKKVLKKLMTEKVGKYFSTLTFITYNQKKIFEDYCKSDTTHKAYKLNVSYKTIKQQNKLPFIIYLTETESEKNNTALRKRKTKYTILFSGSHFKKVCKKTVENNFKFTILLLDIIKVDENMMREPEEDEYFIEVPKYKWNKKIKKDEKIVSIGGKKDLEDKPPVQPPEYKPFTYTADSIRTPPPSPPSSPSPPIVIPKKSSKINIVDTIISNKVNKNKLERSLKLIKSII